MPNRVIKDSLLTSEKVSSLTDFEFRLWVSMILLVDDAGRGDARPAIIKGRAFPLRERVSLKDIEVAVHGLAAKGCVSLYEVGGKPYFWFPTWSNHQRIRDVKPKYPAPEENGNLRQSAAICGNLRPESKSKSESKSESEETRESAFDAWWKIYPKKVGKDAARKSFAKIKVPVSTLISAVESQKISEQWCKNNGQFIPNPATWLNQGRWEDELPAKDGSAFQAPTKNQTEYDAESKPMKCAVFLDECIRDRLPTMKPASEPTLQTWADAFDKLNRIDGQDWDLIAAVLEWSQTDSFWCRSILSGDKFRKQFFALLSQMQGD